MGTRVPDWYDGGKLAALGDIVVVTANYRVGPLGYLYLPEIGAANLGPQDQAAVLRWVRDNVASFGGDPRNVTVGGQSAGAYSALSLALDPQTTGLVTREQQSGRFGLPPQDPQNAAENAEAYLRLLDVPAGADTAKALRALPVEQLLSAYGRLAGLLARPGNAAPPMYPVLGGPGLPCAWQRALADGALEDKALLIGTTRDEATAFFAFDPRIQHLTSVGALDILTGQMGEQAHEVYQRHAARLPQAIPAQIFTAVQTGELFRNGSLQIADHHAAGGNATYLYQFDYQPAEDEHALGATHCVELPFLFNTFDAYPHSPMLGTHAHRRRAGPGTHFRHRGRRVRHDRLGVRLAALRAHNDYPHPVRRLREETSAKRMFRRAARRAPGGRRCAPQ
ncbi:carboxylesterase family protein [Streptomyces sp. NPDC017958]|uniref:carboxylesterase family protein n=1 Tax=Streptomyces sp. NPDC017958 TaxID=3365021 RepID=UPI0037923A6C